MDKTFADGSDATAAVFFTVLLISLPMIGMAAVKKAAKHGYKRYGIPGAVVAGLAALLGIRFLKRKLRPNTGSSTAESDDMTDSQASGGAK